MSEVSQAIASQRADDHLQTHDDIALTKKRLAERIGVSLLVTGGIILVASLFFGIIRLMISKGAFWTGLTFLAFLTALIAGGKLLSTLQASENLEKRVVQSGCRLQILESRWTIPI